MGGGSWPAFLDVADPVHGRIGMRLHRISTRRLKIAACPGLVWRGGLPERQLAESWPPLTALWPTAASSELRAAIKSDLDDEPESDEPPHFSVIECGNGIGANKPASQSVRHFAKRAL
jgi:hypothetical protein